MTTGYDVITTEPEWDAQQRQLAMSRYEHKLTICNCGCGLPVSVAHKKDQLFVVDENVCYARRAIEKVRAKKRADAERTKQGEGWDAGLKLHARPVSLEEAKEFQAKQMQAAADIDGEEPAGPRVRAARQARASTRLGAAGEREHRGGRRMAGRS